MITNIDDQNLSSVIYAGVGLGVLFSSFSVVSPLASTDRVIFVQSVISLACYWMFYLVSGKLKYVAVAKAYHPHLLITNNRSIGLVALSYMFEGMGYIIYATYIFPYLQKMMVHTEVVTNWFILGAGAALGPIVVAMVSSVMPIAVIIKVLFLIQILSILCVLFTSTEVVIYISVLGLGMSFMGLTSAFIILVKIKWKENIALAGYITIAFSIGQAMGPILAGAVNQIYSGYWSSIVLSLAFVSVSMMLMIWFDVIEKAGKRSVLYEYQDN
jgi:MFS family permease